MSEVNVNAAFMDIGKVRFSIDSSLGNLILANWGPDDVSIEAIPGNDGNIFNIQFGAMGQMLASKDYTYKNWGVTIRPLRYSRDYARLCYLIQQTMNSQVDFFTCSIENNNDLEGYHELLTSSNSLLVGIPGFQYGKNVDGSYPISILLSNAVYESGAYNPHTYTPNSNIQGDRSNPTNGINEFDTTNTSGNA